MYSIHLFPIMLIYTKQQTNKQTIHISVSKSIRCLAAKKYRPLANSYWYFWFLICHSFFFFFWYILLLLLLLLLLFYRLKCCYFFPFLLYSPFALFLFTIFVFPFYSTSTHIFVLLLFVFSSKIFFTKTKRNLIMKRVYRQH